MFFKSVFLPSKVEEVQLQWVHRFRQWKTTVGQWVRGAGRAVSVGDWHQGAGQPVDSWSPGKLPFGFVEFLFKSPFKLSIAKN